MASRKYALEARAYDKRGRLISVGHNSYTKTHPLQKHFSESVGEPHKIFLHAELAALLKAAGKEVHKLSISRFDRHGSPVNAAPCKACQAAIKAFGVKLIEHTL